jgi:arylsulfatase A-like enzyme
MNKRNAMVIFGLVAAALLPAVSAFAATPGDGSQPNIVYILADDLGWKDVGFHGSNIKTPNIDRLAATGARLEQFYAEPMCTPTRAALMTGRYPVRYGLQTAVIPSAGKYGLATDEWLLPQALREAGYETAIVGKWHLGHAKREYWPRGRGFDHQYGAMLGEIDYFTKEAHGTRDWFRDEKVAGDEGYVTTLLGDEAVKLIDEHDPKKPLFLYLAFTAPHAPYQAPKEYLDKYSSIEDPARRAYAAMITAMDDQIGRVLAALEKQKMLDNTLIIFHSDNGGPRSAKLTGEVDTSGGTIPPDNGPYRDGKGSVYEGGTRVAALASWPGRIKSGTSIDQPIHVVDMYPTLAGLAAASVAKQKPLDGVDMWPTISEGKPSPRREVVYNVEPSVAGIREGDWKLVWTTTLPTRVELFNLRTDPFEKTNVAEQHPEKVVELQNRAEQLAREGVPPLVMEEISAAAFGVLTASVTLPEDERPPASNP